VITGELGQEPLRIQYFKISR